MSRPGMVQYFLQMSRLVSTRATCKRRQVGCVLVNKYGHVLATGYNGVARGETHCIDRPCPGASQPSGQGLELCEAVHAEQNALLQCQDSMAVQACFCTTAPCLTCVKLLMNTSCQAIYFLEDYPHAAQARDLWERNGMRRWQHYTGER